MLCVFQSSRKRKLKSARNSDKSSKQESEGYTHCLIRGPMSFPETLEMDLRKPWVDTSIWLHIWLWYFWDEAVLARLRSLLKTWWEAERTHLKWWMDRSSDQRRRNGERPAAWTPCWSCFRSASSPGELYTGTSCSTPRTACGGAWWRSGGAEWDWAETPHVSPSHSTSDISLDIKAEHQSELLVLLFASAEGWVQQNSSHL